MINFILVGASVTMLPTFQFGVGDEKKSPNSKNNCDIIINFFLSDAMEVDFHNFH